MRLRDRLPFFMNYCSGYLATVTGNGSVALPKAKANGLNSVKLFGGIEQRNLPVGYTELEYIEAANETQYITTNIIPDWTTEIDSKFRTGNNKTFTVLSRWTNSPTADTFGVIVSSTSSNIVSYFGRYSEGLYQNDVSLRLNANQDVEYKLGQSSVQINTQTYSITRQNLGFENTLPLWIFKGNFLDEPNAVDPTGSRVYSLKIKTQGKLVFNGIPAKRNSDNVLGMYDTVSGQFLTNQGTGSFIAGSEVIPTPDYPMDIVSNNGVLKVGPNSFNADSSNITIGYWINNNTGEEVSNDTNFLINGYIPVKPNTSYVAYGRRKTDNYLSQWNRIAWYDSNKNYISTSPYTKGTIGLDTSPSNAAYARFSSNPITSTVTQNTVDSFNWTFREGTQEYTEFIPYNSVIVEGTPETVILQVGSTSTTYEPYYNGGTATAEMLLKVGDYQDVQSILDGVVTRNIGVKVLDGTENWVKTTDYFRLDVENALQRQIYTIICSHYPCVASDVSSSAQPANTAKIARANGMLYITETAFSTVDIWKQFLADQYVAGTPVIIVYPLATPTTESVAGQTLQVQKGNNILEITQASIDNLVIEATYKKSR